MLSNMPDEPTVNTFVQYTKFSPEEFLLLGKKGKNEREQKYLSQFNSPDTSALLTVINPDESERPYINLRNILVSLHNNQYLLNQENNQNRRNYAIKPFIASTREKLYQNDKIKKLKAVVEDKNFDDFMECIPMIHQLFEVIKLQYDQICSNALMFQTVQDNSDNLLKSLYFHLKYQNECVYKNNSLSRRQGQRMLVINLLGCEGKDFALVNNIIDEKGQILYISLSNKRVSKGKFYYNCYINGRGKITWEQFKTVYRIEMRNMIQKFNPQLCILQLGIDFNQQVDKSYLSFEEDCLEKIMRKFSKVSKNKLIALLTIKETQQIGASAIDPDWRLLDQKLECLRLKAMINSLQQGVLRSNTPNCKHLPNYQSWLPETIAVLKIQSADSQIIGQYQQLLNNLMVTQPSTDEKQLMSTNYEYSQQQCMNQGYFHLINPQSNKEIMIVSFMYDNQYIKIYPDTEVHFRYEENIVAILQPNESALFYAMIDYQKKIQNCYKFNIHEQKINTINPTIAIDKGIIYLLYGFLGDKVLQFDTKTHDITVLKRAIKEKCSPICQWQREGARVFYNFKNEAFVLVGGELLNDAPQICNVFESIYLRSENTFVSGFFRKDELFKQQSHKPWQNQAILENEKSKIFLPGNYDNHRNKYYQVINSDHYKQAQMLTLDKNGKYVWTNLDIQYRGNGKHTPNITVFTSNQRNVCQINENTWKMAVSGWEEETFGDPGLEYLDKITDGQQSLLQANNFLQKSFRYVLHSATINLEENKLIVHIDSYQIGGKQVITKQPLVPEGI